MGSNPATMNPPSKLQEDHEVLIMRSCRQSRSVVLKWCLRKEINEQKPLLPCIGATQWLQRRGEPALSPLRCLAPACQHQPSVFVSCLVLYPSRSFAPASVPETAACLRRAGDTRVTTCDRGKGTSEIYPNKMTKIITWCASM